ncbi:hypothetical protein Tco_0132110 [Tanacetum coccineum]
MALGIIPPKTKGSKKKANTDAIPKLKPPTAPKEKKSGKGKQKLRELVFNQGFPCPDYDSEDDISWKSSDDDQADEQAEDDEDAGKNDVNETTQDDEDDDDYDDDEKVQDADEHDVDKTVQEDDDEEQTESDNDDEENSDNDVEGTNVEGAKMDEEATYEENQGTEEVKDTNTDLDGRDKVMTDVEDTHVTLTPVNPDGQQPQPEFVCNLLDSSPTMLNPNQEILQPSWERPPTPHPIIIQPQQLPIMTPATTTSSLLQNLPNFTSLFGFDHRLKMLEDNFLELRQTNQYAEALSSIPSTVGSISRIKCRSNTNGDTVTIKRPRDGADDMKNPPRNKTGGPKEAGHRKEPASTSAPSETTTKTAGKTTSTGSKTHKKSASQSAPVGEAMPSTDVFERSADQEFETVSKLNKQRRGSNIS